jgi:hypothetical protein
MYKIILFQYKSQFTKVFNVNPGNQGSPNTYLRNWALLEKLELYSHARTSQDFMEPEGPLPCSQEPSTGPYPEPDQSSP